MNATKPLSIAVLCWAGNTLALALAYWAVGKFSLLLAIPPGYATPVWPAAGIALAGILFLGARAWPGIVIGSFLVNAASSVDLTGAWSISQALLLPAGIGLGAALQAVVQAAALRWFIGFPRVFENPIDILKAMMLCAPLGCLLSASVGVTSLVISGRVAFDDSLLSWSVWWLGDTIGVLLAIPLISAWGMELRHARMRVRVAVGLPLCVGAALSVALFFDVRHSERHKLRAEFERRADIMARAVKKSIESKLQIVRSVASYCGTVGEVDRDRFRAFVGPSFRGDGGLYGLSWNVRVSRAQRDSYEEDIRDHGDPSFHITERATDDTLVTANTRDEYVVVHYIEPQAVNQLALGYDLRSDSIRAAALDLARDSGEVAATPPVVLVEEPVHTSGFVFFAPVYDGGHQYPSVRMRRERLHSFVSGVFRTEDVVGDALAALAGDDVEYRIVDKLGPGRGIVIYASGGRSDGNAAAGHQSRDEWSREIVHNDVDKISSTVNTWATHIDVAGRHWSAEFWHKDDSAIGDPLSKPWLVLAGGFFLTSLLGAFLLTVAGRAALVERLVGERTSALSRINADLNREIAERMLMARALEQSRTHLERRVAERTSELVEANAGLQAEICERERLEDELLKAQKLESLGLLAGGIAHDFNNLLTAIGCNLSLVGSELDGSGLTRAAAASEFVREAEQAVVRATGLTRQLLTFSRGGMPIRKTCDLAALVRNTGRFVVRGSLARCYFELPDSLWLADVDEGQIDQVVSNLVINATQAMPDGGTVRISAANVYTDVISEPMLKPGRYVELSFADEGVGIPPDQCAKVFDPYFTTKAGGSGLGLATAYSIVGKHQGRITVSSEIGVGTTFVIYLPASDQLLVPAVKPVQHGRRNAGGRLLVMDDEESICTMVKRVATRLGYEVAVASDGVAALARFAEARRGGTRFDAVILDLTIPGGMGGLETLRQLRIGCRDVVAIASSGYSEDPVLANYAEYGFCGILAKPYTVGQLRAVLQRIRTFS